MTGYLVSVSEIARLLSVSRQRADQLTKMVHFPRPEARLANGSVWNREAVITWLLATGRLADHPDGGER